MLRKEVPRLFPASEPMSLGKPRVIGGGSSLAHESDIALVTAGMCTEEAMRVTAALHPLGVSIAHLHVTTLKPFRGEEVAEAAAAARFGVITMKNHSVIGGLGSATAEVLAGAGAGKKLRRLGIRDTYLHGASQRHLMKEYGIDAFAILGEIEGMVGEKFPLSREQLEGTEPSGFVGGEHLEAL